MSKLLPIAGLALGGCGWHPDIDLSRAPLFVPYDSVAACPTQTIPISARPTVPAENFSPRHDNSMNIWIPMDSLLPMALRFELSVIHDPCHGKPETRPQLVLALRMGQVKKDSLL